MKEKKDPDFDKKQRNPKKAIIVKHKADRTQISQITNSVNSSTLTPTTAKLGFITIVITKIYSFNKVKFVSNQSQTTKNSISLESDHKNKTLKNSDSIHKN
jgi:hypothetical protein